MAGSPPDESVRLADVPSAFLIRAADQPTHEATARRRTASLLQKVRMAI